LGLRSPAPGALPTLAAAGDAQQGADRGAAGAGAVPDHPAREAAGLGAGAAQSIGRTRFLDWEGLSRKLDKPEDR